MPQSSTFVDGSLKELIPLGRRVVVRPTIVPKYAGTLIMPDSVRSTVPTTGTVVALGFDLQEDPGNRIQVGDKVLFGKYSGLEAKFQDGKILTVMHEEDVQCIVGAQVSLEDENNSHGS